MAVESVQGKELVNNARASNESLELLSSLVPPCSSLPLARPPSEAHTTDCATKYDASPTTRRHPLIDLPHDSRIRR